MGGSDKCLAPLAGRPLFTWSLEALERCDAVDAIVIVGPIAKLKDVMAASGLAPRKILAWTEGGKERQHSVARGLALLPEDVTHVFTAGGTVLNALGCEPVPYLVALAMAARQSR